MTKTNGTGRLIVALCGVVGAGKTHTHRTTGLSRFPRVDVADYYRQYPHPPSPEDPFGFERALWAKTEARKAMVKMVKETDEQVVVYEATNLTTRNQMELTLLASSLETKLLFVWVTTKLSTARENLERDGTPHAKERREMLENIAYAVAVGSYEVSRPNCYIEIVGDDTVLHGVDEGMLWVMEKTL